MEGPDGAQIPYFVKILGENIKRYQQLKIMIGEAREHRQYLRVIHAGLENSIGLLDSLPIEDDKIMAELVTFKKSLDAVANVYGKIPQSKEALLHTLHDQTVAESLRMITSFKNFTRQQEENSLRIAIQGRQASPRGAATNAGGKQCAYFKESQPVDPPQYPDAQIAKRVFGHE